MKAVAIPEVNNVQIAGYLPRDPLLKQTKRGWPVVEITVVMVRRRPHRTTGRLVDEHTYVVVEAWGQTAEELKELNLRKGSVVVVNGHLHLQTWTRPTGERRNRLIVLCSRIRPILPRADVYELEEDEANG